MPKLSSPVEAVQTVASSAAGRRTRRIVAEPADESDLLLMEQIRDGDRGSLGILLERYWNPLVTYASGVVSSGDEAEDVVQETFVRVWRFRGSWQPSGTVAAFLYRITRNLALNSIRNSQSQKKREERGGAELLASASAISAMQQLEEVSLRKEVEAAIEKLPTRRREIFVLSRFHGLSHREIAESMGVSLPTVSNQMTSALTQMREALAHHLVQH